MGKGGGGGYEDEDDKDEVEVGDGTKVSPAAMLTTWCVAPPLPVSVLIPETGQGALSHAHAHAIG